MSETINPPAPPSQNSGPPALPSFMTQIVPNYEDMRVGTPKPLRLSVDRDGTMKIKRGKEVIHIFQSDQPGVAASINGVIVGWGRPRAYWQDPDGADGGPDCSSDDGVKGLGTHMVQPGRTAMVPSKDGNYLDLSETAPAPQAVIRPCATCPLSQFGSAPNGSGQACKQMIKMALYVPTAHNYAPWLEQIAAGGDIPPIIVSLSPTNLQDWDKHIAWIQSIRYPIEGVWTKFTGKQEQKGAVVWGKFVISGLPMTDSETDQWFYNDAKKSMDHPIVLSIKEPLSGDDYNTSESSGNAGVI